MLTSGTNIVELARLLGTTYGKISYFYYKKDKNRFYKSFEIKKKTGGVRQIYAPNQQLKELQERISKLLLAIYKPRPSAKAFLPSLSIVDNARPHCNKTFVFNIDLENFFPSISFARIRALLIAKPYQLQNEVATVIAHLCTLDGRLPQGSPSSPVISNMICSRLDRQLQELAKSNNSIYTRYADDITFSFRGPAGCLPSKIVHIESTCCTNSYKNANPGEELAQIISSNGFTINQKKVRLQSKADRQVVTGLTVNKKPNIDRKYIRKTSALIHAIEQNGIEHSNEKKLQIDPESSTPLEASIHGRLLFIHQVKGIDSDVYKKLALRFNALNVSYKVPIGIARADGSAHTKFGESIKLKCWVIESDENFSQGTAFTIEGNRLLTCSHFFHKNGDIRECVAYRISDRKRYSCKLIREDIYCDIAILEIQDLKGVNLPFFDICNNTQLYIQDRVSILGFPNFKGGAKHVNRMYARITNFYPIFGIEYAEIDKDIFDGNSGGPVLNNNNQVVGIAAKGADDKTGHNAFIHLSVLHSFL